MATSRWFNDGEKESYGFQRNKPLSCKPHSIQEIAPSHSTHLIYPRRVDISELIDFNGHHCPTIKNQWDLLDGAIDIPPIHSLHTGQTFGTNKASNKNTLAKHVSELTHHRFNHHEILLGCMVHVLEFFSTSAEGDHNAEISINSIPMNISNMVSTPDRTGVDLKTKFKQMIDFLLPLNEATEFLCKSAYLTLNTTIPMYIGLMKEIISPLKKPGLICAMILDPCIKTTHFENNWQFLLDKLEVHMTPDACVSIF
ncbi:uncharacterized protein VP01_745g4 [Puccinia sorghi]|uniref:Uncharacterized protein n=1 Tax=Puccinia sorghi TaxID=27349 RepID=A0A0L6UCF3_9BASI|nr:uncharacterized protein VP01_745g4 [Puccinia sorghi]